MMSIPMRTTTIEVDCNEIDHEIFANRFQVVRYTIPKNFHRKMSRHFALLHSEVQSQMPYPYYFFSYDKPLPGLFALLKVDRNPPTLELPFLGSQELPYSTHHLHSLRPDVMLKLMLANYFTSRRDDMFSAHGHHYVVAKSKGRTSVCLEIELRGDRTNPWVFKVLGRATNFMSVSNISPYDKQFNPHFARIVKGGLVILRPLLASQIDTYEGEICRIFRRPERRATLDYHETLNYEETRGAILHRFASNFTQYLCQNGITARQRLRQFIEYKPQLETNDLPISNLGTVNLFDNRLNQKSVSISHYSELLNSYYGSTLGLGFQVVSDEGFAQAEPILVLQDCAKKDFDTGAVLEGWEDPYRALYGTHPDIAKQSINVNLNEGDQYSREGAEDYLDYSLFLLENDGEEGKRWDQQLRVCFNQLYLKHLILSEGSAYSLPGLQPIESLPNVDIPLQEYAFIRRATVNGVSYTTLLYVTDGHLRFVDLRSPEGKCERHTLLSSYGLDWSTHVVEPMCAKYYKEVEDRVVQYDFIIGPGQVVEVEDIQERVLYDYDTIHQRRQQLTRNYPVEELKLIPHAVNVLPKTSGRNSVTLEQLVAYDAFLDELLADGVHVTSYAALTAREGSYRDRIVQIFDIQANKNGQYNMAKFKRCYQRRGMFLSAKSKDVIAGYQGIWYDENNCFMIGSPDSMNKRQPRAHLIRQFDIYQGEDKFKIHLFLDTMAVKFVRYKQFTVYPYFFHLIDMFVDMQTDHVTVGDEAVMEDQVTV